ncbi:MAG: AAA family ATPase [Rhodanobacter sp.]
MRKKPAATNGDDSNLWGDRPVKWGLRMLTLRGRPLALSLSPPVAWGVADFLGLDLPEQVKLEDLPDAIMPAVASKGEQPPPKAPRQAQLWRNLRLLKRSFGLNATELDIIAFRAMLRLHPGFGELATKYIGLCVDFQFHRRLAAIFDASVDKVEDALDPDGRLVQSGLISVEPGALGPLDGRLRLPPGMISNLVRTNKSVGVLLASLLSRKRESHLCLDDYSHLHDEVRLLRDMLREALSSRRRGANVLLHGVPGTGKTELAAAIAAELNCPLYESRVANDGVSLHPRGRLGTAVYLQRIIPAVGQAILLVDEAEDLFPTASSDFEKVPTKATINECLERNPTPTIWISNGVRHMDEAFLRRFDLVLHISSLPTHAKCDLLRKALPAQALEEHEIRRYASQRELSPAMLTRLVSTATGAHTNGSGEVRRNLRILSSHYLKALGVTSPTYSARAPVLKHDLDLLNTDIPLQPIIDTMAERSHGARMLLHGLPGTGKTAFGKAIAERLDRPLLQRQASALLSSWVGGTERNLREMFDEARQGNGILLLDEADSFLCDRTGTRVHWETTHTNELLTQIETFDGVLICTTNRLDNLDPAALRRFDLKVEFRPLQHAQRLALLRQCCAVLSIPVDLDDSVLGRHVHQLDGLTPGDAAAALRRLSLSAEPPTVEALLGALATECRYKPTTHRAIGFVH